MAEEVAQEALLAMWRKPEAFDPCKGTVRSFVIGIARYKAIDVVREEQVRRSKEALLVESAAFFEIDPADHGVAEGMDLRTALWGLPAAQRQALFFAYYRGFSYRQVAEVLELPEGTVKTRIRDGLIGLRTILPHAGNSMAASS